MHIRVILGNESQNAPTDRPRAGLGRLQPELHGTGRPRLCRRSGGVADPRARQYIAGGDAPEAPRRDAGSVGNRPDARIVLRQMLEAFSEGLLVCGQLYARLANATYQYASRRLEEFRDPVRTGQDGRYNDTRPTLRMRMDDGFERALDALETRARELSPMAALRRARAALTAKAAEADVRIARIWWPDKEREDKDMDVIAPQPVAPPDQSQAAELDPVRPVPVPEPVVKFRTEAPRRRFEAPTSPAAPTVVAPLPPSDSISLTVQSRDLPDTFDPPEASSPSSDLTDNESEPSSDPDRDDRPWFLRVLSLLSFLRPRETRVPSVFDRSLALDTASDDAASEHARPEEPEGLDALERRERMLNSSTDAPLTEDELEALSRRRPREL